MKKILFMSVLIAMFNIAACNLYASDTIYIGQNTECGPWKPIKNKATYGHSRGTYRPKSFYSRRKAPKNKNVKNMPSASGHIIR